MALVGLKYIVAAPLTETGTDATYANGFVVGKGITANINVTTANQKLYADDAVAEVDNSFTEGTIELNVDDMTDDIQTKMLGHNKDAEKEEIIAKGDDVSPNLGVGFYGKKLVNNTVKYRAIWFRKVQFSEPSETMRTKENNVTFQTPSISGTVMTDVTGVWKQEQTFDTEAGAKAYLDELAGIATA